MEPSSPSVDLDDPAGLKKDFGEGDLGDNERYNLLKREAKEGGKEIEWKKAMLDLDSRLGSSLGNVILTSNQVARAEKRARAELEALVSTIHPLTTLHLQSHLFNSRFTTIHSLEWECMGILTPLAKQVPKPPLQP